MAYHTIKKIVEQTVTSGLIYLPSHIRDFNNPEIDQYLQKYVRGSNNIEYRQRIKILKLLWDAIGTEFGGRHELYEINYAGSQEEVRLQVLGQSTANGTLQKCFDLVDQCLSDYDENGWNVPHLTDSQDINILGNLNNISKL